MATRYYINLPDPARARGNDPDLAFRAQGAEVFASQLQDALRGDALFQQWRAKQDDLQVALVVTTVVPSSVLRQRLGLLAGSGWQLRDVTSA